nr:hypothetical protein [Moraxella osloensis]
MKNNIRIANLNDIDELEKLWSGYQKFYNVSEINSAKNKEFIRNIINKPSDGVIHISQHTTKKRKSLLKQWHNNNFSHEPPLCQTLTDSVKY